MIKTAPLLLISFFLMTEAFGKSSSPSYKLIPESEALSMVGMPIKKELESSSLKALIWNIKKAELKNWQSEFLRLGKGNDLLLVQETYKNNLLESTLNSFSNFHWTMATSFLVKRDNYAASGTMIGSTVAPSEAIARHTVDLEPIIRTPKSMTMAKYPVEDRGEELLVISIHAINFHSTLAFERHIAQAIVEIKKHVGPILFAGDFNTWNQERMVFLKRSMSALGLNEVIFKNVNRKMKVCDFSLDHAFVRGINVKNAEIINSDGSDHNPMLIEFDIL